MPRKVSTGRVGGPVLGSLSTQSNTFSSVEPNASIIFEPDGTGLVQSNSDIQTNAQTGLRFADLDSSNYIKLISPEVVSNNVTLTLPATAGTNGYTLVTDGAGVLNWAPTSLTVTNRSAADNNNYLLAMVDLASASGGTEDTLSVVDDGRLQYNPNTNTLTAGNISTTSLTATTADINGGNIDGTAIGGNAQASAAFTTLTTTGNVDLGNAASDTLTVNASIDSNLIPSGTRNLGSTGARWSNLYVNDLSLSNGIGDYTIVEGEEDLFLYNNKKGKVFKFALIEVDASEAPPKIEDLNKDE